MPLSGLEHHVDGQLVRRHRLVRLVRSLKKISVQVEFQDSELFIKTNSARFTCPSEMSFRGEGVEAQASSQSSRRWPAPAKVQDVIGFGSTGWHNVAAPVLRRFLVRCREWKGTLLHRDGLLLQGPRCN